MSRYSVRIFCNTVKDPNTHMHSWSLTLSSRFEASVMFTVFGKVISISSTKVLNFFVNVLIY